MTSSDQRGMTASPFPGLDQRFSRFSGFKEVSGKYSTLAYGHAGKPKVLWYDITALVRRGAFVTAGQKGTVFNMDHTIGAFLGGYAVLAAIAFSSAHFFSKFSDFESLKLEKVSNYLNMFIPFILGLYVSISLTRWWALRTEGIGTVLNSCQNIALITSSILPGPDFAPYEDQLLKYALASVSLTVNMCRAGGQQGAVEALGPKRDNLLTAEEVAAMSAIPYRTQAAVMWAWILLLAAKTMEEHAVAPSKQRDVTIEVVKARDAIEKITTYMQTQLPFAYVHLVTLLVNLNNVIMALKCGVVMSDQINEKNYMYAGAQVVFLFTCPLLYQGLLSVSNVIHDPFGEDLLDFPVMAYQEYANEASVAITAFTFMCPALKKKWGVAPNLRRISLLKGAGKVEASLAEGKSKARASQRMDVVNMEERQLMRQKEEEQTIIAQMRQQDDLVANLRKQNVIAAAQYKELSNKLQAVEARFSY